MIVYLNFEEGTKSPSHIFACGVMVQYSPQHEYHILGTNLGRSENGLKPKWCLFFMKVKRFQVVEQNAQF